MENELNRTTRDMAKLKEIPKWTRKYAQNRTIPNLVQIVIFLCIYAGIGVPSYFLGKAVITDNKVLTLICVVVRVWFFLVFQNGAANL